MRQYKWKKSLCMFLALLMLFSTFSTPQATFSADNVDVIENAVEEYVKSWFFENFSEHYILSDYSSSVSELTITGDEILATVPLGAYTTLKYTSVDSLPYMLGIKEKLNISSLAEIVPADFAQKYGKAAVAELRKSVDYGVETSSSSAVASKLSMDSKGNSALTTKRAVDTLKNSMHITSAQAEDIISLVANNFVDAAECIGVPTLLTLEINASGGDCANYVSQCLKAAGLGTTSNWYYNNNGSICTDSTHDARVGHTCTNTHICGEAWRRSTELRKELSSYYASTFDTDPSPDSFCVADVGFFGRGATQSHSVICVATGGNSFLINSHNNDRKRVEYNARTIASNSLSRLHIHSGNSWTKYNATYHRGLCNGGCGEFVLAQHYARTPGSNATCLGCGYVGNISIGLMSMGDKLS